MKNSISARFARAFFMFWHFVDVLVLSTTWNELFCSCVDDVSIWWQMFNFVSLCPKPWFQINSRIVRRHFSSIMALNNWKMIAEKRSYIFRWRSRFRRRRVCLSSLLFHDPYESWTCIYTLSLSNDIHFTNCTTRKPLFHDPYKSWTCIYTLSLSNDIHFTNVRLVNHCFTTSMTRTNRTSRAKRNMPLYGSYEFLYIGQPSRIWSKIFRWKIGTGVALQVRQGEPL